MGGCETHSAGLTHRPPGSQHPSDPPVHGKPQPSRLSSLAIISRRLPASSSFLLAAARLRGLQLDPRPRRGTETSSYEESPAQQPTSPADYQVTGSEQHALLTVKAPMGGTSVPFSWGKVALGSQRGVGVMR
jgi:hypothetical protein